MANKNHQSKEIKHKSNTQDYSLRTDYTEQNGSLLNFSGWPTHKMPATTTNKISSHEITELLPQETYLPRPFPDTPKNRLTNNQ